MPQAKQIALILIALLSPLPFFSQINPAPAQSTNQTQKPATVAPAPSPPQPETSQTGLPQAPTPAISGPTIINKDLPVLKQSPRIAGVLPNFTAVNSNTLLPPLTTHQKFVLAMHDSIDYSSFLLVGALAAKGLQSNATPQLGTGAAGFGRYYWREFTDQVSGTFFTEAILPTLTREDPRYYTYGKDGFFQRAFYAISRTVITKNDAGGEEFNISEIGGNAAEATLSNFYYPSQERGFDKTAKNFATQTAITAGSNVLKEFWPDIRKNVFRINDN
ncbi:MAG: hypothetical protein ABI383_12225 [Acidobacteriaceae bacterium]